ncbi:MAG: hypothetical protein ACFNQI_05305, partial [Eikenella corrodens]
MWQDTPILKESKYFSHKTKPRFCGAFAWSQTAKLFGSAGSSFNSSSSLRSGTFNGSSSLR